MDQRVLGRTGIRVSPLCLGSMMFGSWGNTDESECVLSERKPCRVSVEHCSGGWLVAGWRSVLKQRRRKLGNGAQCGVDAVGTEGSGHGHPWLEGVQTTTFEAPHDVDTKIALVAVRKDQEPFAGIAAIRQLRADSQR